MTNQPRTGLPEDTAESLLEGDDYVRGVGTARSAFSHREFRLMWLGSFGSNIGTWMQTVVLGAYAYTLTGSAAFVGALTFAQLGPLIALSLVGGLVADLMDRRKLLIILQIEQLVFSALLAVIVANPDPSRVAMFACVLAVGVGNALNAPAWGAVLPSLVGEEDLGAAISLNSTMINGSRVIGPALGGVLYPILGASWIFAINAATYLAVIGTLLVVRFPEVARTAEHGWARVVKGFRVAQENPVVGRVLVTLTIFSLFCLPFIGLLPTVAEQDLGLDATGFGYGILYACFGLGACLGALSIGTVLASVEKMRLVRVGLFGFALAIGALALLSNPAPAYPVIFVLGFVYFGTTTAMLTVLQTLLTDEVRGRVMALWFMSFGGGVGLAAVMFGPILDATSGAFVLGVAAVVSAGLSWWCNLRSVAKLAMIPAV